MDKYLNADKKPNSISEILSRVQVAERHARIAVFKHKDELYSFFDGIVKTEQMKKDPSCNYVGSFHKEMAEGVIEAKLKRALD